ncbi:MAG: sigma-70 family RNA polymerase sigma factor [Chloroflexi bacterium]|nr:sigma-70 family RNA polymerase sigma factor [Chloroflexota bacterium]
MDWQEMFARLSKNPEDALAWSHLQRHVRVWARREFRAHGWHCIEDVIVDTCSAVATGMSRAYGPETFRGFVFGHFLSVRRHVLRRERYGHTSLDGVDVAAPAADDPLEGDERGHLMDALVKLPPREQRAVRLRHIEGFSGPEIAAELGVSQENARLIVHRGISRLRRQLRVGHHV